MDNKTFRLEELNSGFWSKVILINIWPSSGHGGPGSLWIVTSDKKQYFISYETFPFEKMTLSEFCPILKKKEKIVDYAHPFAVENNGWKYLPEHMTLIRDDFYESFIKMYDFYTKFYKERGLAIFHMPTIAGYALGINGEPERYNEEKAYLLWEQREKEAEEREKFRKSIALTKDDFVWNKLRANNIPTNHEEGEYALLFKNVEEKVVGYKFTILYQREEIAPLAYLSTNKTIEYYILLEQKFDDVFGPLYLSEDEKEKEFSQAFDYSCSLDNYTVNSYGEFIRAFKTKEEAKEYLVEVANIRDYANKHNIIKDIDDKRIMYKNWLRKYQGIIAFREHYKEILKIVCNYKFKNHCAGGKYLFDEIVEKTNIDKDLLKEMWQYIPLILTPQTQEKAQAILSECKEYLENGVDK